MEPGGGLPASAPLPSAAPRSRRVFSGPFPPVSCLLWAVILLNRQGRNSAFMWLGKQRPTQISVAFYGQVGEPVNLLGRSLISNALWEPGL